MFVSKRLEQGMGMLEVLVSLLLLAVGMLGFAALQTSSVKATNESVDRTKALTVMQSTAEKIRTNPSAMATYKTEFSKLAQHGATVSASKMCGLDGKAVSEACTPDELAEADISLFSKQFSNSNLIADIVACPRNSGTGLTNSDCLIIAWDDTAPTVGADPNTDCLTAGGSYHPAAACMFMEVN